MILSSAKDQESQEKIKEILKKEFDANPLEKGSMVMLDDLINQSVIEENGRELDYDQKLGKRAFLRVIENTNKKLKQRYGRYAALSSAKLTNGRVRINCNLHYIYRTKNGWIYGTNNQCYTNVFFSTHCIDRFKERMIPEIYMELERRHIKTDLVKPSAFDLLLDLFFAAMNVTAFATEFAFDGEDVYINLKDGILVLTSYQDLIFVAKTFLLPHMLNKNVQWYEMDLAVVNDEMSVQERLKHGRKIDNPFKNQESK